MQSDDHGEVSHEAPVEVPEVAANADEDVARAVQAAQAGQVAPEASAASKEGGFWEQFNRSVRGKVAAWSSSDQFHVLVVMRLALSPVLRVMFEFLRLASRDWELEQEAQMLRTGSRGYRVLEAFRGSDLARAFQDLYAVLIRTIPAIPFRRHTRSVCVLLFRLVARVSAVLHQLLRYPRRHFPYMLFSCLSREDADIQAVRQAQPCLLDDFSEYFLRTFPQNTTDEEDGICGSRAQAILSLTALLALVDISNVESKHATIRRVLEASSVQTWRASLAKLSAEFAVRQNCSRREELARVLLKVQVGKKRGRRPQKKEKRRKRPADPDAPCSKSRAKKKPHRSGGGGACRAFISERLRQNRPKGVNMAQLFRDAHKAYRATLGRDRQQYVDVGSAATLSHKSGNRAFGPVNRAKQGKKRKIPLVDSSAGDRLCSQLSEGRVEIFKASKLQMQGKKHQRQLLLDELVQYVRGRLGLNLVSSPVSPAEAFEQTLTQTCLPHVQTFPCFELFPPNAKVTKDSASLPHPLRLFLSLGFCL